MTTTVLPKGIFPVKTTDSTTETTVRLPKGASFPSIVEASISTGQTGLSLTIFGGSSNS